MNIVDAQIHIWSSGNSSELHWKVSFLGAEEALRDTDEAGVDAALIHWSESWDPAQNALAVEAARKCPDRFVVMGQFPPD